MGERPHPPPRRIQCPPGRPVVDLVVRHTNSVPETLRGDGSDTLVSVTTYGTLVARSGHRFRNVAVTVPQTVISRRILRDRLVTYAHAAATTTAPAFARPAPLSSAACLP